jgi:hypothetical protein
MYHMNRLGLMSLPLLLIACGEEPETIKRVEPEPNIELSVETVDFGELLIGSLSTESLTIRNTGENTLIVQSISALPPFTSPSGGGFELEPETETNITVQFIPTTYTSVEGTLTIVSTDPDEPQLNIPITGSTIVDVDQDGFDTIEAGGVDCDDDDANINPDAIDEWYDGVDSDCAGDDDYDQDGDGFQTTVWNEDSTLGGGDCQDNNPNMYPGASDEWYDGVDSNCDGVDDFDQDGDGSRSELHGRGSDCDDLDPSINLNGTEAINGVDDDCDGDTDYPVPAWNSDRLIEGTAASDYAGWALTTGDIDQDGKDDVFVGMKGYQGRGGVAVFTQNSIPALSTSTVSSAYNIFSGQLSSDQAGFSLSFLEDPGLSGPALAIGAPGASSSTGRVYLLEGDEAVFGGDLDDAYLTIDGTGGSYFGDGLTQDIDLDGDGLSDIFGHYRSGSNNYYWLLYGDSNLGGSISYTDVDLRVSTTFTHANAWRHMPSTGDLDGDGFEDIVHCDHRTTSTSSGYHISGAHVIWGDSTRYDSGSSSVSIGTVSSTIVSTSGSGSGGDGHTLRAACGIMPDWNGDGMDEFWAFFTQSDEDFTGIYVFDGQADWKTNGADLNPNNDASYFFLVSATGGPVANFRDMGDWDGDGISEVGIGFGVATSVNAGSGKVWMISSQTPPGLQYNQADLAAMVVGDDEYGQANYGNILSSEPGDLNNDGLVDWLAADWGYLGNAGNSTNMGGLYLTYQR